MAFIQSQLCIDRKMRKGLRGYRLAEHSMLTHTCVDKQSPIAQISSGQLGRATQSLNHKLGRLEE